MTIGQRIQELRKNKYLSQEEMAEQLEVSKQSISKWELDKAVPGIDKIIRMCELYGVTSDYLLMGKEDAAFAESRRTKESPQRVEGQSSESQSDGCEDRGVHAEGANDEGTHKKELKSLYLMLGILCVAVSGFFLVVFAKSAVHYIGFSKDTQQDVIYVDRIYRQQTEADVSYWGNNNTFYTKKVWLDTNGVNEGDWIFGYRDDRDEIYFPYRKGPLVMIVLFSVLFMTAAVLCIIRYARIGKKEKEDGKKQPEN